MKVIRQLTGEPPKLADKAIITLISRHFIVIWYRGYEPARELE